MNHNLFKLFHIVAIVIWLGPSTGGYLLILISHIHKQPEVEMWLRREYVSLIYIETTGFLMLLSSGLGMLYSSRWALLKQWWLRTKLAIILIAILPIVALQFYIYHIRVKRAFMTGKGMEEAIFLYDRFSIVAFLILALAVPAVFWLAVFKPKGKELPN